MGDLSKDKLLSLIGRACEGDGSAFDEMRAAYDKSVRGYLKLRTWRSPDDLEDMVQDVWLETLAKIGSYDSSRGSFYTFLTQCIASYILLRWNEVSRVQVVSMDDETAECDVSDQISEGSDPAEVLMERVELEARHDAFLLLSRLLFLCGGYPHQQLAFAFSKLIYSDSAKGQGNAAPVVDRHGVRELASLATDFLVSYSDVSGLSAREIGLISSCMTPLQERFGIPLEQLLSLDRDSTARYADILDLRVGDTALRHYYEKQSRKPAIVVADWSYGVQQRLRAVLDAGGDGSASRGACGKCKLRGVVPCAGRL